MAVESYRDLNVWKKGVRLTLDVYKITSKFPVHERFGLVSQMRRCAVSIPPNLAEGHARLSTREYVPHVSIALGSLAELETQLYIAMELRYVPPAILNELLGDADILGKQLRNLIKSLRRRIDQR